jgi:hypothetical protein
MSTNHERKGKKPGQEQEKDQHQPKQSGGSSENPASDKPLSAKSSAVQKSSSPPGLRGPRHQRRGGPRTPLGKERSKYNALKHGIFARLPVLPGESRREFRALAQAVRDRYQPEGSYEIYLVDWLALLLWRRSRVVQAELGELRKSTELPLLEYQQKELFGIGAPLPMHIEEMGLARFPSTLADALHLLQQVGASVKLQGFEEESDFEALKRVYGKVRGERTLVEIYLECRTLARAAEDNSGNKSLDSPEDCKAVFLKLVDEEKYRLAKMLQRQLEYVQAQQEIGALCGSIPDGPALDCILRYQAKFDRAIERALAALEQTQRYRFERSVLAPHNRTNKTAKRTRPKTIDSEN